MTAEGSSDLSSQRGQDAVLLGRLRGRLAREGLNIVLPLSERAFDDVCVAVHRPRMKSFLASGAGAVVIADGGSMFFDKFRGVPRGDPGSRDPLDAYTRESVETALRDVCADDAAGSSLDFRILHPFSTEAPALPFQRLGVAAGLPSPGPLGLQVHPTYGPWWAYRAIAILAAPMNLDSPLASPCDGCRRPCETGCPAAAVSAAGFSPNRCGEHRRRDPGCHHSCAARLRCPVGGQHAYSSSQLTFHMTDSLAQIRLAAERET